MSRLPLTTLTALALAIGFSPLASAEDEDEDSRKTLSAGVRAGAWFNGLSAKIQVPQDAIPGTKIKLKSDLDLPEYAVAPAVEVFLTSAYVSLYADYFSVKRTGQTTLDTTLTFAGSSFTAGLPVEAEFELESFGVRVEISPFSFDNFQLGLLVGARYFNGRGLIRSRLGGVTLEREETFEAPVPAVGAALGLYLGPVELKIYALGLDVTIQDYDIFYLEFEATAGINFGDHFGIVVGYRGLSIDATETQKNPAGPAIPEEDKRKLSIAQTGPTLSVRLRF